MFMDESKFYLLKFCINFLEFRRFTYRHKKKSSHSIHIHETTTLQSTIFGLRYVHHNWCVVLRKVIVVNVRADATVSKIPDDAIVAKLPHTLGAR